MIISVTLEPIIGITNTIYVTASGFFILFLAGLTMDEKRDILEDEVLVLEQKGLKKYYNFGLFRKTTFVFYVTHFVLGLIVYFITLNTIPYYLGETFGLDNFQAANIKSWYPIGEVFGRVTCLFFALMFSSYLDT